MTKKDYVLIAQVLKKHFPQIEPDYGGYPDDLTIEERMDEEYRRGQVGKWANIVRSFSDELESTFPNFKRGIFLKACGINNPVTFDSQGIILTHPSLDSHLETDAQFEHERTPHRY